MESKSAKFLLTNFLAEWKIANCKDEKINLQIFIYSLIYSGARKKHFVKAYTMRKFDLSCSIETYHFEELP